MKGYLIKDLLLIKNQKRTIPLLFFCGFFMSFAMEPISAVIYLAILGTMVSVGTISYDEMDRGFSFLFSLPPARKTYVREKYLFSLLCTFLFVVFGWIIALAVSVIKNVPVVSDGDSILFCLCGAFLAAAVMQAVIIPVRIKFGTEKSSLVMVILFAIIGGCFLLIRKGADLVPEAAKETILRILNSANTTTMLPIILLLSLLLLLVSEQITERIITGMEF